MRLVTADQFGGISDMLRDLENEFNGDVSFDTKTAERIRKRSGTDFAAIPTSYRV